MHHILFICSPDGLRRYIFYPRQKQNYVVNPKVRPCRLEWDAKKIIVSNIWACSSFVTDQFYWVVFQVPEMAGESGKYRPTLRLCHAMGGFGAKMEVDADLGLPFNAAV